MVKDHKGKSYRNYMLMCRKWNIPYELFRQRHSVLKWPIYEALETPVEDGTSIFDHEGQLYDTFAEMCTAWEISAQCYRERRKRGWSRKDALLIDTVKPGTVTKDTQQILSLFDQLAGMTAEDLLVAVQLYVGAREQKRDVDGAKYEQSPRKKTGPTPKIYTDRDGNQFSGLREACEAYGQAYDLAKHRIFDGCPLQFALEYPSGYDAFEDHLGNIFSTYSALCKYYEIDKHEFAKRYNAGWTLKDALMLPIGKEPYRTKEEESL